MRILFIFFPLLFSIYVKAQDAPYEEAHRLYNNHNYDKAYQYFDEARSLYHEQNNSERERSSLIYMGDCLYYQGKLSACLIDYKRALQVASKTGNDSPKYEILTSSLAEYEILSSMERAYTEKTDMQKILAISDKIDSLSSKIDSLSNTFKSSSSLFLQELTAFSNMAISNNNSPIAESYFLKKEEMIDSIHSDNKKANQLNLYKDIRQFYTNTEQYEKAIKYSKKFIDCAKETLPLSNVYIYYTEEALIYAFLKQRELAVADLNTARIGLKIEEDPYAINNIYYHVKAASVYQELKDWEKSSSEYRNAIAVLEKNEARGDLIWDIKVALAGTLFHLDKYEEARYLYGEYMRNCKEGYGENSLKYANALKYLANIEGFCGDIESGEKHYVECMTVLRNLICKQFKYVSFQEREGFWKSMEYTLRIMTDYALRAGNVQDEFTLNCYEALLFSKAFLLETDRTLADAVNAECTAEEKQIYYEWQALQQKLTDLSSDAENNRDQITTIQKRTAELGRRLTTVTSRLGYTDFINKEYKDIKASLKDEEMLIDFTDFYSDRKVTQHMAYVIDNKQDFPLLSKYVTTEDVMTLLDGLPIDRIHDARLQERVQEMFWKPLSRYVADKKTIYYVPSGILHQIALESIPMNDGSLLGEHYNFVRLTSAREIERYKSNMDISDKSNALLYGGLRYSLDDETMQMAAAKYETPKLFAMRGTLRGDSIFHELPYALEEVTGSKKILDRRGVRAEVLSGADGTEESFICLDGKAPQILHLSTHGFYYTPEQATEVAYLNGYKDAMALSGLILSGGNAAWLGKELPKNVLGGVLTANTIARLNLKGTDLLFLAACQTGNGKVTPEGIYGLQRAFKKAGVKTIVMSLWDVDDKVAKEFSVSFYEELTKNGWDKRKAFEKAKSRIRKMKDYKEPFYWAGFVMLD